MNESMSSHQNTEQPPASALVEASGEYDPFLVHQFQPSRTFVSQGVLSMPLDATPEQDSLEEADLKSSMVTEIFIQEEQKVAQSQGTPFKNDNDEFEGLVVMDQRNADQPVSMANIPQDIKEYLEEDNKNIEEQPFNEVVVENFDISKVEER